MINFAQAHESHDKLTHYQFEVDWKEAGSLPEDPRVRLDYFTSLKALLSREREKIKNWHRAGAGGREVIQAHTGLMDEMLREIVDDVNNLEAYKDSNHMEQFALVAVGGYGRGELNPCSDVDLLFLVQDNIDPVTDQFIQEVVSVLWGIGLEIGQSCRTIKDCIKLAKGDLTIKTSMIETRFLTGNIELFEKLVGSVTRKVLKTNVNEFFETSTNEKYSRFGLKEGVACHSEPDIKNGPGGLRDYHVARWAVAVRFGVLSFREIGRDDVISDRELDLLEESLDHSLRVRNELHYLTNKKSDILTLDIQKDLAHNLGYNGGDNNKPVERFMQEYFLHATNIYHISETLFERCLETKHTIKKIISSFSRRDLRNGFYAEESCLKWEGTEDTAFETNPQLILEAFKLCFEYNLELGAQLKRRCRLGQDSVTEEFLSEEPNRAFLYHVLDHGQSARVLRLMHEVGLLGVILPEFCQTHCQVNYDFYHRYTTDEHSLRMVRFLEELSTHIEGGHEELAEVYGLITEKRLIKLACLLHSLRGNSENAGNPDAPNTWEALLPVAQRLHLGLEEVETLNFLINHLYEMMETAFHQDMHQLTIIEGFVRVVDSIERLQMLFVISYAELRAVAPDTWTAWKKSLLIELYNRTRDYLEDPESVKAQFQDTRAEVFRILEREFAPDVIEHHLEMMPEDYLFTVYAEEIASHLRLIHDLADKPFIFRHEFNESVGFHTLTVSCPSRRQAFKKIVGTLTAKNFNILGAQIYRRKDGPVIVTLQVDPPEHLNVESDSTWEQIETVFSDLMENRLDFSELLNNRTRFMSDKNASTVMEPHIQIDNTTASHYSVVRIEANDHLGMLYKIAKVFADHNVHISRAKISCTGEIGTDVFYVSHGENRVLNEAIIRELKEDLLNTLNIEKLEDIH